MDCQYRQIIIIRKGNAYNFHLKGFNIVKIFISRELKTLDFKKNIWYNTDSTIDFAQRPETPSGLSFM